MSSFLDGRILKIMQRRYKFEQLPFASLGTERKDGREGDGSLPGLCRGPQLGSESDRKTRLHLFTAPKLKRCYDLQITMSLFFFAVLLLIHSFAHCYLPKHPEPRICGSASGEE